MGTSVCVVGGGPAGLMLGLLLARRGIAVTVLEKHADFLRDFRGDTVHPSTLNLLSELGLDDLVERLPGRKVDGLRITFDEGSYTVADFSRLPGRHPYLLFLPQWDFLDLIAAEAAKHPGFTLLRSTEVTDVLRDAAGTVTGVRTRNAAGVEGEVRAALTVACDGRFSVVREKLGLRPIEFGAPMDVLWFRVSRRPGDAEGLDLRVGSGGLMIVIDRGDYFQCALVIDKGGYDTVRAAGLDALRAKVTRLAPSLTDRAAEIGGWDDVKLLTVRVNRLARWHGPGFLLIGDAAHAMSPIGGVGINLAVQDAAAAARLLGPKLSAGTLRTDDLAAVAKRRRLPTVAVQTFQRIAQKQFVGAVLRSDQPVHAPGFVRLLKRFPGLQAVPARLIGLGIRPEHLS